MEAVAVEETEERAEVRSSTSTPLVATRARGTVGHDSPPQFKSLRRFTHLARGDPGLRPGIPLCEQETERVPQSQGHAREKGPLFTLQPVVVLDVVRIREERVETQEGDSVQVGVPRQADVQGHARNFGRDDLDRAPVPVR